MPTACLRFGQARRSVVRKSSRVGPLANMELSSPHPVRRLGFAALMAYAGEYVLQGLLWPEGIIDDTIDEEPRDWIELVLVRAARTVRQLCPVVW